MDTVLKTIYSVRQPARRRNRPMQVLCLGVSRSGTETLQHALITLGYGRVTHGFDWWFANIGESVMWMDFLRGAKKPTRENLDKILGDCAAVTDVPGIWFAEELLDAYPEAKVVLNRREDLDAWKESFRNSILPMVEGGAYHLWRYFESELFWGVWLTRRGWTTWFHNNFEKNAIDSYKRHYERLEAKLRSQDRPFLHWTPSDGWEPLCEFLDKSVPIEEFPSGNVAAEFGPKLMKVDAERFEKAKINAFRTATACIALMLFCWRLVSS